MTVEKISSYYKWISLATLALSIFGALTMPGESIEKLGIGLIINLQFHLAFQFVSRMPFASYQGMEKNNPQLRTLVYKMFRGISIAFIVLSIIGLISFIISVIESHDYEKLFATMTFAGMFLGGYSSNLKFKELKLEQF